MEGSTPSREPAELAAVREAFHGGRFEPARVLARRLLGSPVPPEVALEARRLLANASFRLGHLPDTIEAGHSVIDQVGASSLHPARFDALALLVVAYGERAEYDASIEALRQLLGQAQRGDSLRDHVRARGSMAVCFTLMGDPWAGQRVLGELGQWLEKLPGESALEATVHNNHASIWLQIARSARDGGDAEARTDALVAAQATLQRARDLAGTLGDERVKAFADVHECEALLLAGDAPLVLKLVRDAMARADDAGLSAHGRFLRQLQAEAFIESNQPAAALRSLRALDARLGPGHDLTSRIRQLSLMYAACAAIGDYPQALVHIEQANELETMRAWRRAAAASKHLRLRLELEHVYKLPSTTGG